jgi:hypothetical protein
MFKKKLTAKPLQKLVFVAFMLLRSVKFFFAQNAEKGVGKRGSNRKFNGWILIKLSSSEEKLLVCI